MDAAEAGELLKRALALPALAGVVERLGAEFTPRVCVVGGAVRDLLTGGPVVDLDLVVEGPLDEITARLGGRLRSHERFSTATVELDGVRCDLAEARRESYAQPGALPDVEPADIEVDLRRRDFTVNAIALALTGPDRGRVIAAPGAMADVDAKRLRVLHDRSFLDDPTRLLRMSRYASRLGYAIEPHTRRLAEEAVAGGALDTVSGPRIGNEVRLLAAEADPVGAMETMAELGLGEAITPGFDLAPAQATTAARAIGLLPPDGRAELIVLAMALTAVEPNERAALLDRLGFVADDRERILAIAGRSDHVAERMRGASRPSEVYAAAGPSATSELVAVAGALGPEAQAREWLEQLRDIRLEINGDDLLAAGLPAGPGIGDGLAAARDALLDGRAPTREAQLAEAVRAAQATG